MQLQKAASVAAKSWSRYLNDHDLKDKFTKKRKKPSCRWKVGWSFIVHETFLELQSKSLATHRFVISGLLQTWMALDELCGAILCIFRWHCRLFLYPNTPGDGGHLRGSLLQSGWYTGLKINPQELSQGSPPVRKQLVIRAQSDFTPGVYSSRRSGSTSDSLLAFCFFWPLTLSVVQYFQPFHRLLCGRYLQDVAGSFASGSSYHTSCQAQLRWPGMCGIIRRMSVMTEAMSVPAHVEERQCMKGNIPTFMTSVCVTPTHTHTHTPFSHTWPRFARGFSLHVDWDSRDPETAWLYEGRDK